MMHHGRADNVFGRATCDVRRATHSQRDGRKARQESRVHARQRNNPARRFESVTLLAVS